MAHRYGHTYKCSKKKIVKYVCNRFHTEEIDIKYSAIVAFTLNKIERKSNLQSERTKEKEEEKHSNATIELLILRYSFN